MPITFIGLGSNIGNREINIEEALIKLKEKGAKILYISYLYVTEPYGHTDQPWFLNGVAKIKTELAPRDLLQVLLDIESGLGRKRRIKWGPRTIDLDILFYDNLVINEKGLTIPHSDLHNRKFVLEPLNEIDPEFIHPVFKKKIKELYHNLKISEGHLPKDTRRMSLGI